jgi:hypothetical protein
MSGTDASGELPSICRCHELNLGGQYISVCHKPLKWIFLFWMLVFATHAFHQRLVHLSQELGQVERDLQWHAVGLQMEACEIAVQTLSTK